MSIADKMLIARLTASTVLASRNIKALNCSKTAAEKPINPNSQKRLYTLGNSTAVRLNKSAIDNMHTITILTQSA